MTEREINEKAREIYTRCFDDVGEYVGVINALVIAVRETSRELEAQIKKMKCCGNCKYYQFQNDVGYYTCTRDGKRNGKNYRSCEFNLEKWEGR